MFLQCGWLSEHYVNIAVRLLKKLPKHLHCVGYRNRQLETIYKTNLIIIFGIRSSEQLNSLMTLFH